MKNKPQPKTCLVVCRNQHHAETAPFHYGLASGTPTISTTTENMTFHFHTMEAVLKDDFSCRYDQVLAYLPVNKHKIGRQMFYALVRDELPKLLKNPRGLVKII